MSYQPQRPPALVMRQGPQPNQAFSLHKIVLTLGRAADNDIVIDDAEVSRHHARLTLRGNDWVLEDLGSRNGTFVNGQRITGPVLLRPGSQVALGPDVLFSMEGGVPVAPVARRPAARKGDAKWLLLAGLAVLVVAVLTGAVILAYFYLNPPVIEARDVAELFSTGPDIAFQEPAPGTQVGLGGAVLVFATARDEDKVTRVDLWVDDQLVVQQDSSDPNGVTPLSLIHNWVATSPGTHALMVRAYNSLGAMGESPTLYVTVFEEPEPTLATAQYIVQPGDTLAQVAKVMSATVAAIQGENPAMGNVITPGQIIVVPVPPKPPSPPQQGQTPGGQQPGDQAPVGPAPGGPKPGGSAPGGQPQPVHPPVPKPGQVPGAISGLVPGAGIGWILDPPNARIKAPYLRELRAGDCTVTLIWDDRSDNETTFLVYRHAFPGAIIPDEVAKLGANQVKYEDKVPRPGDYQYYVIAARIKGAERLWAKSNPLSVKVPSAINCVESPRYRQLIFQPINLSLADSTYKETALFFDIAEIIYQRIPEGQATYLPPGDWSQHEAALPAPQSVYLNPGDFVLVDVIVRGRTNPNAKPHRIDNSFDSLPQDKLTRTQVWKASGQKFDLTYHLWIQDVQWTGKGTSRLIPAPTNLRFATTKEDTKKVKDCQAGCDPKQYRVLVWDWPGSHQKTPIAAYILYRSYSCPGQDIRFEAPQIVKIDQQGVLLPAWKEPVGCDVRYQVSAFGPAGESAPSAPLDVKTAAAIARVRVTFKEIVVKNYTNPGSAGSLALYANHNRRWSEPTIITNTTIDLTKIPFVGKMPANSLHVNLLEGESLNVLLDLDDELTASTFCRGDTTLPARSANDWQKYQETLTIGSKNGSCQIKVEISGLGLVPAGQAGRTEADIAVERLWLLGSHVYARLGNNGPDDLLANRVRITSYWIKPGTQKEPWSSPQVITRSVSIPANKAQEIRVGSVNDIPDPHRRGSQMPDMYVDVVPLDFDDPHTPSGIQERPSGSRN